MHLAEFVFWSGLNLTTLGGVVLILCIGPGSILGLSLEGTQYKSVELSFIGAAVMAASGIIVML